MIVSKHTLTLPSMSDLTGVKATEPRTSAGHQLAAITTAPHHAYQTM
jgi:hypothetical protein